MIITRTLLSNRFSYGCGMFFTEQQTFPKNHYFGQRCVQYLKLFSPTLEMKTAFISEVFSSYLLNMMVLWLSNYFSSVK